MLYFSVVSLRSKFGAHLIFDIHSLGAPTSSIKEYSTTGLLSYKLSANKKSGEI